MALTPHIYDMAEVTVRGQPGASKRHLYWLAMTTAMRLARRLDFVGPAGEFRMSPPGFMEIQYDAAADWVKCIISYEQNALVRDLALFYGTNAIYNGPDCEVIGNRFNFVGGGANPGIPLSADAPESPRLPFEGDVVITDCPVARTPTPGGPVGAKPLAPVIPSLNPKPPGDNRSRGAVVVPGGSVIRTPIFEVVIPGTGGAVPMGTADGDLSCCPRSLALVPIVFAALTDPGEFDQEPFVGPLGGPAGA